jgi:outer membrane murein-binding lipoprotein Lpp
VRSAAALAALAAALGVAGCGSGAPKPSPSPSGIGAEVKAMELDMNTMREANAAADDVIRAAGDCDAARPLIAAANARLDEVQKKIQTATARQTLEALRKKVRDVSESCP